MAKNVTSVAVEFGVELDKFRNQLKEAGNLSTQAQREAVKMWIKEEKKRTKEAENAAKKRERAEKRAAAETEKARQEAEAHTKSLISGLPVVGTFASGMDTMSDAMKAAKVQVFGLQVALAPMIAAAAGVTAIVSVFSATQSAAHDARTEIAALNQTTGLLPETLGGIRLAGGDELLGKLGEAAGEAQKRIFDAARGTGEAKASFDRFGISLKDSEGNLRSTDAVLRDFIGAVQDVESPTQQAAEMTALFGGAGRELNAALGDTSLADWAALTNDFGYDYGPSAIRATNQWNAATSVFQKKLQSLSDLGGKGLEFLANRVNELGMGITAAEAIFKAFSTGNFSGAMDEAQEAVKRYQLMLRATMRAQEGVQGGGAPTAGAIGKVGEAAGEATGKLEELGEMLTEGIRGGMADFMNELDPMEVLVRARLKPPEKEDEEKTKMSLEEIFTAAQMFSSQTSELIIGIGEHVKQQHGEQSVAYKKTMRDLFAAQKAAAISEIIIAGAVAVANAFKLDPIFGAIMTPIIAANSAVQIATVASEQPSFHTGGMIPSQTAAPDEVGITALSGEGVVSRRGMAALDAINRGDMMGGGSAVVVYGARVFDAVQGDLIQTPTSSISRAIRAKTRRRVGHRS